MDYCMIVLEKIINPLTPENQIYPLLKDLMDCVPHLEMKALAQRIVDPSIDQAEKRRLMEEFRTFDHGGRNDFSEVDYCELMDKFLDPNLPDHEYKPTMKALIEGDLDQERKNQVSAIITCQDKEQKAKMVKRWKSSFEKEKEEKLQQEREFAAKRAEKKKKQNELKAKLENLLEFEDDGMTLIMRMLDKTIPADKKTEIYDRLMEPDVAADIKNLSIQLISLKKQSERVQRVEDFKKEREAEKIAQANRNVEAEKKRLEEEQAMKEVKMQRKKELLAKSNKDERMKKRDLMLKLRAKERMADEQSGYAGPSSMQERDEMRRRERERVRQEILRFREQSRKEMKRQEREDMRKEGWMVLPFETEKNYSVDVQVVVADLDKLLVGDDQQKFAKALANLKIKQIEDTNDKNTNDTNREKPKTAPPLPTESVQEQPDAEFDNYFKIFSDPNLTLEEEKGHFKKLIAESKSALVRKLVVKLATDVGPGVGKSAMFKALAKKFVTQAAAPALVQPMSTEPKPATEPVNISEEKNGTDKPSNDSLPREATKHADDNDRTTAGVEEARPGSAASQNSQKSNKENKEDRKRNISGESVGSNASKKLKLNNHEVKSNSNEKRQRSESPSSRSEKKKKKKHKKEKKHHKEKSRHKDKDNPEDEKRKTSSEHKSYDAPQDEKISLPSSLLQNGFDYKGEEPLTCDFTVNYSQISKYHLQKLNCYVKIKNQKKLYRAILKQEEMRKLHEQSNSTTPVSRTPSPLPKTKSRSRSRSTSLASRSSSRSPVRFVSRTPSPAKSKSRSLSRSLSRSRSRSRSVSS